MKYLMIIFLFGLGVIQANGQIKPISPAIKKSIPKTDNTGGIIRYRITINGFAVNRPTTDHVLEVDGKGDEVYCYGYAEKFDASGNKIEERKARQSLVFGDVNNEYWRMGERIKAGTMRGEQGGLQKDDRFPTNEPWKQFNKPNTKTLPFIIADGMMQKGETVIAIPSLWEYDGTTDFEQGLNAFLSDATKVTIVGGAAAGAFFIGGPGASVGVVGFAAVADMVTNQQETLINEANNNPIFAKIDNPSSAFNVYVRKTLFGDAKDRSIGMEDAGNGGFKFSPLAMKLDYDNMIRYAEKDFGFGRGVLPIKYIEPNNMGGAHYTLYIQIEATDNASALKMDHLFNPDEAITAKERYTIRSAHDNRILDANTEGKATLKIKESYDVWKFTKVSNTSDQFYIVDAATVPTRVLDVFSHSMDNGGEVITYPAINASNQRWRIISCGDGTFSIIANESGKALSFDFKTNKLIQYENRYNPDQRWRIE